MKKSLAKLVFKGIKAKDIFVSQCHKALFAKCGNRVSIGRNCIFYHSNLYVGNDVAIGSNASLIASVANIYIGNHVMFGPGVTIRGGTHRIDVLGEYMKNVKCKLPENDQDVVIEDDVWIGANVTILKGVRIGKGSVIGAGSLVTKSVPPYTIHTGVPETKLKPRFNNDELKKHQELLMQRNTLV